MRKTLFILLFLLTQASYANDDVEHFKASWVGKALALQREIDVNVPLNKADIIGTHNSYNAKDYQIPLIRYVDPNQIYSLYDQLELGARSVELDAHWTWGHWGKEILMCHGTSSHLGCSAFDRPFTMGLQELRSWLNNNPHEVVLLYIERHVDGHEPRLTSELIKNLGNFIYKPTLLRKPNETPGTCMSIPTETLTKADVLKAGKQVIIVTKECADPAASYEEQNQFKENFNDYVFSGMGHMDKAPFTFLDSTHDSDVTPYPDCSASSIFVSDPEHTTMWRLYDDLTAVSSLEKPKHKITIDDMHTMLRCNINWQAMDMMDVNDDRLRASIWSWAQDYPKAAGGQCAIYKRDTGIENISCETRLTAYACQEKTSHNWKAVFATGKWQDGETFCQSLAGSEWHFAMPINGKEMFLFQQHNSNQDTAVNYVEYTPGHWKAN